MEIISEAINAERAAVIAVMTDDRLEHAMNASLDELERLLETAGGHAFVRMIQKKEHPDVRTYLGKGKLSELSDLCRTEEITLVVADTELSPSQIRNMEQALDDGGGSPPRVIDRSMLILDIFALHAGTAEGKLQVELAQLRYTAPRLIGKGLQLSRQGGGSIAARGPGETKLETDRRHISRRIQAIEEELSEIERRRATQRKARDRSGICKAAIVGYTNAGKSTLLNRLTDAGILAEDKLFATLDPTTRRFTLPDGHEMLLVDTVGFIRNLPTHLIKAFRSTLDEAAFSDVTLIVADASDPEVTEQLKVTTDLLESLGASGKPTLLIFNKCDAAEEEPVVPAGFKPENVVFISALDGRGIEGLTSALTRLVNETTGRHVFIIPVSRQDVVAGLYRDARVESAEYGEDAVRVTAVCGEAAYGRYGQWAAD
ncbi:MAG: GTPase HflX [Clostridia bacterium]|nr:GTPase HflX [Clostridia bacterium]